MQGKLKDKNAVIVGASRGIGAEISRLFAEEGARVFLIARNKDMIESNAENIRDSGGEAFPVRCDINSAEEVQDAFALIGKEGGRVDCLVNSAAILEKGLMNEIDEGPLSRLWETNVLGIFRCCRGAYDLMKDNGGSIVNISSLSGVVGVRKFPSMGPYNISKYGLWGLTEILALEWAEQHIRVNAVSPSGVKTDMYGIAFPGVTPSMVPADVAKVCLFLASDDSAAITGANIIVKGPQ
jgi:NAD(P)-dependent dehydrogenase (short-subunit alcohol dehydrogenase family)